jgi:ligand-binding sensor domain-containing protein
MMTRVLWLASVFVLTAVTASAQVGVWRNYTSMKSVRSVDRAGNTVWAASDGGLFSWQSETNEYHLFTNAEGLKSLDLTAVGVDNKGNIWAGSSTGIVHVYSPASRSWRYVQDIAIANQTNKRINRFSMHGDTTLICTAFGLSLFKADGFEFGDTYTRFGTISSSIQLSAQASVIFAGNIWVAITDGQSTHRIAVGSLSNPNLLPPESWTLQVVGSTQNIPRTLTVFNNRLYCGTSGGLYYFDGTNWVLVTALTGSSIVAADASPNRLVVCTATNEVFLIDQQNLVSQYGTLIPPPSPTSLVVTTDGTPVIGTTTSGLLTFSSGWIGHEPNGPNSSQFINVVVDLDGRVWGASGNSGFYRFNGNAWKSFTRATQPALLDDNIHRISLGCDGTVWASSFGRGLARIPRGADTVRTEDIFYTNVGMVGLPNDTLFVVTSPVGCDSRGNTWFTIINSANKRSLFVRRADGTWQGLPVIINGVRVGFLTDTPVDRCVAVDGFDNVWTIVRESAFKGMVSLGNQGAIDSIARFHLTSDNGLPSNDLITLVLDRSNDIWVGTERGIGIILDPSNPTRTGGVAAYKPLNGIFINCIAVDPLNQKWVGTTEGVVVLSPDGTQLVATYTVENTDGKLLDNNVKSIAIDGKTGTVYFGTLNGLASLTTTAAEPKESFDKLVVSPNPYLVPSDVALTVDGLVASSTLKILSIDGRLIKEVRTPGGRIGFWDGTDTKGETVATGVYLIVGYSEDGSKVGTGKVAVVRR